MLMSLFSDYIRESGAGRHVIEINGVAFVTYFVHTETKECYIEEMYVHPRYRNRGLGFKLLRDVAREAKGAGCVKVRRHSRIKKLIYLYEGKK